MKRIPIDGIEYYADEEGNIYNKNNHILKGYKGTYHLLMLCPGRLKLSVHRLVCLTYHPNPLNLPQVNHKDGNKLNNHKDNLEWSTRSDNQLHAIRTGLQVIKKGNDCSYSKLTEEQVLQIRELYSSGSYLQRELGVMYNVKQITISNIITRRNWKHI